MDDQLTVGKVAKECGVNVQTVHYYERMRLVYPNARKESGYRLYGEDAVRKIRFIKNAQVLGFSLKEIAGLLRLRVSQKAHCGDIKRKAHTHIMDVRAKIARLLAIEKTLGDLIRTCRNQATTDHCPILKSLEVRKSEKGIFRRREI